MPEDAASRERRIAAAVAALGHDLDGPCAQDASRDAELRRRLQDLADLFLAEAEPAPPADAEPTG